MIPAIANAVAGAIKHRINSTPITPEKVLKALDAAQPGVALRIKKAPTKEPVPA